MFIDILLSLFAFFFLIRELIPNSDPNNPRLRRNVYSVVAGLFFLLSLINIYNKNEENEELLTTAKEILGKTEDLNHGQTLNLNNIKEAANEIRQVDSTLGIIEVGLGEQVELLEQAVYKSTQLAKLEEIKLKKEEAELIIYNSTIRIVDSIKNGNSYDMVEYIIENIGERKASPIHIKHIAILYNHKSGKYYIPMKSKGIFNNQKIPAKKRMMRFVHLYKTREEISTEFTRLIIITNITYKDVIYDNLKSLNEVYVLSELTNTNPSFNSIDSEYNKTTIRDILKSSGETGFYLE